MIGGNRGGAGMRRAGGAGSGAGSRGRSPTEGIKPSPREGIPPVPYFAAAASSSSSAQRAYSASTRSTVCRYSSPMRAASSGAPV